MRGDPQHTALDSVPLGFILGLLFPVLGFFGYGGIYVTAIRPHHDFHWFVYDLFLDTSEFQPRVASLSLIADAVLFFILDRLDMQKAMRGVIAAMMVYGVYIIVMLIANSMLD